MKTRATVAGMLMASWCIATPTVWGGNHDFLKAGGVDDEAVAKAYTTPSIRVD